MTGSLPRERGVAPAAGRERAFDLLRGLCIVSMVFGHLAGGSPAARLTHAPGWVDGAVGFVFISGLVLGLVQRGSVDGHGLGTALARVLRRIRLIYLANAAITLLALLVGTYLPAHTEMPSAHRYGWPMTLLRVLLVAVNPAYSVLGLYVFLMLGSLGALTLLARRRTGLLLALSVAAYVVARAADLDTSLPGHGKVVEFHVAGWQLLYVIGLVTGWHWRDADVGRRALQSKVQLPALVVVLASTCLAHLVGQGLVRAPVATRLWALFDKPTLAPGVLLFAVAILAVGYRWATWAVRSPVDRWLSPVTTMGRHGLASYVILSVATIVVPAVLRFPTTGWFAQAVAVEVLVVAFVWGRWREGRRDRGVELATSSVRTTPMVGRHRRSTAGSPTGHAIGWGQPASPQLLSRAPCASESTPPTSSATARSRPS